MAYDPLVQALLEQYAPEEDLSYLSGAKLIKEDAPLIGKLGATGAKGFLGAFLPGLLQKSAGGFLMGVGEGASRKKKAGLMSEYGQYSNAPEEERQGLVEKSTYLKDIAPALDAQKIQEENDNRDFENKLREIAEREKAKAKYGPPLIKTYPSGDTTITMDARTGEQIATAPRMSGSRSQIPRSVLVGDEYVAYGPDGKEIGRSSRIAPKAVPQKDRDSVAAALSIREKMAPLMKEVAKLKEEKINSGSKILDVTYDEALKRIPGTERKRIQDWLAAGGLRLAIAQQGRQVSNLDAEVEQNFIGSSTAVITGDIANRVESLVTQSEADARARLKTLTSQSSSYKEHATELLQELDALPHKVKITSVDGKRSKVVYSDDPILKSVPEKNQEVLE